MMTELHFELSNSLIAFIFALAVILLADKVLAILLLIYEEYVQRKKRN